MDRNEINKHSEVQTNCVHCVVNPNRASALVCVGLSWKRDQFIRQILRTWFGKPKHLNEGTSCENIQIDLLPTIRTLELNL